MLRAVAAAARRWRWQVLVGAATALGLGLAVLTVVLPQATNGAALTVLTGSMRPTYPPGSLLIVRPVDPASIGEADVITYPSPDGRSLTTHRVAEIRTNDTGALEFVTKGDANDGVDPRPVLASTVQGKVWFGVPYVGLVRNTISSRSGLLVIGMVLVMALGWDRATAQWARLAKRPARVAASAPLDLSETAWGDIAQQLLLLRLQVSADERTAVLCLAHDLQARVVDIDAVGLVLAAAGTPEQLDEVERKLGVYAIVESKRTSIVAISSRLASIAKGPW